MSFERIVNTTTFMSNFKGYYSLHGYDEVVTQILEAYMRDYDHKGLLEKGLAILLLSVTFEVLEKPMRGEVLIGEGTDGGIEGCILRKNINIYRDGKLMVRAACFFGLINVYERKLQMNMSDYFQSKPTEGQMVAYSRNNEPLDGQLVNEVKILPSYIDALGHCNNQRYYEFMVDCMSPQQQSMESFSKVEMFFISEAKLNDTLKIYRSEKEDHILYYGIKQDGNVAFKSTLRFDLQ